MRPAIAPLVLAVLLAGCTDADTLLGARSADSIRSSGWAVSDDRPSEQLYCYRTLADRDCYATPQAGLEGRLITGGRPQ